MVEFNLLGYEDSYKSNLIGNWKVTLYTFSGMDITVNLGQLTTQKLTFQSERSRTVKLHISHPLLAYFPENFKKSFAVSAGQTCMASINIRSFSQTTEKFLVTCVDSNDGTMVHAWVIKVRTSAPNITQVKKINCKVGKDSVQRFVYQNRTSHMGIFELYSSHPDILYVLENKIEINSGERSHIRIKIPAQDTPSLGEACLFISD